MAHLLIVDDEKNIREGLSRALKPAGHKITIAEDGESGLKKFMTEKIDLAILDIKMPGLSGLELLQKIQETESPPPVIFITGHGTVETAVEAMQLGAYDFLIKPLNLDKLELIIQRALNQKQLETTNRELVVMVQRFEIEKLILGNSRAIREVREKIKLMAPSRGNIYVKGESGTGKELVCDAIHRISGSDKPLVKVNCAALSPTLLESELFGHEKGAFTGADRQKIGRFEAASGGTLFLDEISETPIDVQVKLLRVLQEKKIERVGSNQSIDVDIRIICASNKDLEEQVKKGEFREDLFYRLNVLDLYLPPLRERKGDIDYLMRHFFDQYANENNRGELHITSAVRTAFLNYDWPGNIREMLNVIEKMVVMNTDDKIDYQQLPENMKNMEELEDSYSLPYGITMEEAENRIILETLKYCKGNKSEAAKLLGIGRKTLHRKLTDMGAPDEPQAT